jgi:hypothetical protein
MSSRREPRERGLYSISLPKNPERLLGEGLPALFDQVRQNENRHRRSVAEEPMWPS